MSHQWNVLEICALGVAGNLPLKHLGMLHISRCLTWSTCVCYCPRKGKLMAFTVPCPSKALEKPHKMQILVLEKPELGSKTFPFHCLCRPLVRNFSNHCDKKKKRKRLNIFFSCFFNPHPRICLLILERGGGGDRGTKIPAWDGNMYWLPFIHAPGDWTPCNAGWCHD